MGSIMKETSFDYDMLIIGAGISGINSAYRIQTELPSYKYSIIEARNAIGGTWDLFRYPGIRSDSDLHTFGFPWRPWSKPQIIADGESIRNYVRESAEAYGVDKKIKFQHKLLAADWNSDDQRWKLEIKDANGEKVIYYTRFVIFGTGYYDYNNPLETQIPGLDTFKGQVIHPQFWPEDLDYTGKKVVIIGSGATAVTLMPNIAEKAEHVTMLQRSPGYVMALPSVDSTSTLIRKIFPNWFASKIIRWKFLILPFLFFQFCRVFPNAARKAIQSRTQKDLPGNIPHDPNFKPRYNPWEQRLCFCPDGDFFTALQKGNADVVTDSIKTVTEHGIRTENGTSLDADIIVTATGLKMQLAGGTNISIDGKPIDVSHKFVWKGVMLQDVPNAAIVIGYTNASWTLGADTTAHLICRILKHMDSNKVVSATPRVQVGSNMKESPMLNLNSTYIVKAKGQLPKTGDTAPWLPRSNYFADHWMASYGALTTDIQFTK